MAGTKIGGLKAGKTNKELYGDDFYRRIGSKGGRNGHSGGFAANPALASIAGAKGGRTSRRDVKTEQEINRKKDEIIKLYNDGMPVSGIAQQLGLKQTSLYYWVRKNIND